MISFISDYGSWDDTIHENSLKFHKSYSVYPNLMLASEATWGKIDEYANIYNPEGIKANYDDIEYDKNGTRSISSFVTEEYCLGFCVDERAGTDYFFLVFDEDPTFDGEPSDAPVFDGRESYRRIA